MCVCVCVGGGGGENPGDGFGGGSDNAEGKPHISETNCMFHFFHLPFPLGQLLISNELPLNLTLYALYFSAYNFLEKKNNNNKERTNNIQ